MLRHQWDETQLTLIFGLFTHQILILIFAEVLGLYGLIVALILNTKASGQENVCN